MTIKSRLSRSDFFKSWDSVTAYGNFAGGDEVLDSVFIAKRKGGLVYLIEKPKSAHDIFAATFYGFISGTAEGSVLHGFFGISVLDFIITAIAYVVYGFVIASVYNRGQAGSARVMIVMGLAVLALIFVTLPKTRRRYRRILDKAAGRI